MTTPIHIVLGFVLLSACSQAQNEDKSEAANANEAAIETTTGAEQGQGSDPAREAFKKQYPNAQNVSWGKDSNGYLEASFELDGEKHRADYSQDGAWIETETSIKFGKLPQAIQEAIKTQFDKSEITEIERVDSAEKGVFFDVEFKDKGKNIDVEFAENGQIIKK